jgi:two-component system NtrC family response regulator
LYKVLIIDDEQKLRTLLGRILNLEGYATVEASTIAAATKTLAGEKPDIVLCDVKLPDGNGVDFTKTVKSQYPLIEVILLTAYGNIADGVQAMKNGAFDYITKGDDNDKIIPLLGRAVEKLQLQKRVGELEALVSKRYSFDSILGNNAAIKQAVSLARKVAETNATVLLLGETGTGKEIFAQAIHNGSKRRGKSFMALNCSAFGKDLLESELFGHKAGAFTGALKDKKGLMEEASGGTLFLDEIGEMHSDLQAKLLRVLETGEFIKVGDTRPTTVDVRVIAATNRNLQQEVNHGRFREDLFYRINVFTIQLPALRERKEDIRLLAEHFLKIYSRKMNVRVHDISPEFTRRLEQHEWRGNIRELKNVIERAVILSSGDSLSVDGLPPGMQALYPDTGSSSLFDLGVIEAAHIQRVLEFTHGNKTEAARLLNIGLTTLYRKIEEYHLAGTG